MEAFTLLYDLYIDSIYRYILAKTSDVQTAEDLTSEVFFNALKTIHNFVPQQQASVKSWFFRIAHNKVIDCYRTQKNTWDIHEGFEIPSNEDISTQAIHRDELNQVQEFLNELTPAHRQILCLRIWDDLSYRDIADMTWYSLSNCKKIVSRTLKQISANFSFNSSL